MDRGCKFQPCLQVIRVVHSDLAPQFLRLPISCPCCLSCPAAWSDKHEGGLRRIDTACILHALPVFSVGFALHVLVCAEFPNGGSSWYKGVTNFGNSSAVPTGKLHPFASTEPNPGDPIVCCENETADELWQERLSVSPVRPGFDFGCVNKGGHWHSRSP